MRCLALAQEWRDQRGRVVFAMAESTLAVRARITAENCEIVDIPEPAASCEDCAWLVGYAREKKPTWIVLDGYRFGAQYHHGVRDVGCGFLGVDDYGRCGELGADLILNQNVTATPAMCGKCTRSRPLLGPQYILLRKEFSLWRDWKRAIPADAKTILVTLGGSTQMDVARTVLGALAQVRMEGVVGKFVIGGSTPSSCSIERAALSPAFTFFRNPANMPELMAVADIAISAAGTTCWELCFLGVPSLLIDLAPDQIPTAHALDRDGYAIHAGAADGLSADKLAAQVQQLLNSQPLRRRLSDRCRSLVDGNGAARVVAAMRWQTHGLRTAREKVSGLAGRE